MKVRRHPGVLGLAVVLAVQLGVAGTVSATRDEHSQADRRGVVAGAGPRTAGAVPAAEAPMLVAGRPIPSQGLTTVRDALSRAGIRPRDGRLLAVVDGRVLDAAAFPARVYVDGAQARLSSPAPPGSRIRVVHGRDRVEGTRSVRLVTSSDPLGTGLYVGGRAGLVIQTVGEVSGQVVRSDVVRKRHLGRLEVPGAVALTFDDGPDPRWTRQVLALLAEHRVQGVFCQIGRNARSNPALVRAVVAGGHLLCNHTMHHDERLADRSARAIRDDLRRTQRAITRASGGVRPMFFRAPGGNWSKRVVRIAESEGMTPLRWTADPRDWTRPDAKTIVSRVLGEIRPGGVILLHDGGGNRAHTLVALERLLRQLPRLGYRFTLPSARPVVEIGLGQ